MRILITGGGGFIGQKLARKLASNARINDQQISSLSLIDIQEPAEIATDIAVSRSRIDISNRSELETVFTEPFHVIFHMAAAVSGECELDFDLGMRANLQGSMNLLDLARKQNEQHQIKPIIVFASSVAAHGGEAPEVITDNVVLNPQTSYGTQKAMVELLLQDYSRKGFVDGRGLRLPTVSIRPGKPNGAASSFMSSIFREPLQGQQSNCPVGEEFLIWHTAPRTVVDNIIHAATIPAEKLGMNRNFNLPGRTDSVGDMISQMSKVAGPEASQLITWNKDPEIEKIVTGWRAKFEPAKALSLGFKADTTFADNVRYFLEDDIQN